MHKITILLADDHPFLRLGLATRIAAERDMLIVGEAETGEEAIRAAARLSPDVVVMDLTMPGMSGVEATRAICRARPATRVLILTSFSTSHDLFEALRNGATGAFLKDAAMDDLIGAIRRVANGERLVSPEVERLLREEEAEAPSLTERQRDVLESAARGLSDREIALQFGMTHSGAKHHMRAIFAKLGAANRAEAIGIALRKHLLKT